jgi:hypothetical protein
MIVPVSVYPNIVKDKWPTVGKKPRLLYPVGLKKPLRWRVLTIPSCWKPQLKMPWGLTLEEVLKVIRNVPGKGRLKKPKPE